MSPIAERILSDFCSCSCGCCAGSCEACDYRTEAEQNEREGRKIQPQPELPPNPADYIHDKAFQRMKTLITDINLSKDARKELITYCEHKQDDRPFIAALSTYDTCLWLSMILEFYFPMRRFFSEKSLERKMDEEMATRRASRKWQAYGWG